MDTKQDTQVTSTGHVIGAVYRSRYWGGRYRVLGHGSAVGCLGAGVKVKQVEAGPGEASPVGRVWEHATNVGRDVLVGAAGMSAPTFHIRQHVEGSHRGYRSDVKPSAVEAASLYLEWSGEAASVSSVAERLLDGEQISSERDGVIVVATPQPEYVAVDLDANNAHIYPDRKTAFGWGVCRRGHGLQDLPKLSERQAVELAEKLNA